MCAGLEREIYVVYVVYIYYIRVYILSVQISKEEFFDFCHAAYAHIEDATAEDMETLTAEDSSKH